MWWIFKKRKKAGPELFTSIWKEDFSDCVTLDYLPDYSVCRCDNNKHCRHVAHYAGMTLCGNPRHKSFILAGSQPFDPGKHQFKD